MVGKANALTTAIEPREPGAQRVDPSRVHVVVTDSPSFRSLLEHLRERVRASTYAAFGIVTPTELGESIMAGFVEGLARANAIDVQPLGDSECKQPFALTVRK